MICCKQESDKQNKQKLYVCMDPATISKSSKSVLRGFGDPDRELGEPGGGGTRRGAYWSQQIDVTRKDPSKL